jgi:YD repeat-containing protein
VSYTYDAYNPPSNYGRGRRTGMSDASGSTTWTYDVRGRTKKETKVINGTGGGTFLSQWEYDPLDRVTWIKYPGGTGGQAGEQVNYTYTGQGPVNSVSGSSVYVLRRYRKTRKLLPRQSKESEIRTFVSLAKPYAAQA